MNVIPANVSCEERPPAAPTHVEDGFQYDFAPARI